MYLHEDLHVTASRARVQQATPAEAAPPAKAKTVLGGLVKNVGAFAEVHL